MSAVADCWLRGRVSWGRVVKKSVLRLASFPEGSRAGVPIGCKTSAPSLNCQCQWAFSPSFC